MPRATSLKSRLDREYVYLMLSVALPVMLQNLINLGLNLVDVLMIGKLGVNELAAVGAANRIFSFFGILSFGVISGASVYVAQYYGVRDFANIRRVFGFTLTLEFGLALAFFILTTLWAEPLLRLFIRDPADYHVVELGMQYLRIAHYTFLCTGLSFTTVFCSRAIHRLKVTTAINAAAIACNTLLNYGLIFGNFGLPRLGVEGAAVATVIARVLELAVLLLYVYRAKEHPLAAKPRELFAYDRALCSRVLRTSLPVIITDGSFALAALCCFIAYGFLGKEAVAAM